MTQSTYDCVCLLDYFQTDYESLQIHAFEYWVTFQEGRRNLVLDPSRITSSELWYWCWTLPNVVVFVHRNVFVPQSLFPSQTLQSACCHISDSCLSTRDPGTAPAYSVSVLSFRWFIFREATERCDRNEWQQQKNGGERESERGEHYDLGPEKLWWCWRRRSCTWELLQFRGRSAMTHLAGKSFCGATV